MTHKSTDPIKTINIDFKAIPEGERQATWVIINSVNDLVRYVEDFRAALRLSEFCKFLLSVNRTSIDYQKWCFIAGRDGVMTLYHFKKVLLYTQFKDCPTLIMRIDHERLKSARKTFNKEFHDVENMRHAVAHRGETWQTMGKHEKNSFSGSISLPGIKIKNSNNGIIQDTYVENNFYYTFKGRILSYELSDRTLNIVSGIAREYYNGFI